MKHHLSEFVQLARIVLRIVQDKEEAKAFLWAFCTCRNNASKTKPLTGSKCRSQSSKTRTKAACGDGEGGREGKKRTNQRLQIGRSSPMKQGGNEPFRWPLRTLCSDLCRSNCTEHLPTSLYKKHILQLLKNLSAVITNVCTSIWFCNRFVMHRYKNQNNDVKNVEQEISTATDIRHFF